MEVLRQEAGKPDKLITKLGTGQYFGELGLIRGGKRIATVRAATEVEVMALDRDTFGTLMDASEASWQEMDKIASQRAMETEAMAEVA